MKSIVKEDDIPVDITSFNGINKNQKPIK